MEFSRYIRLAKESLNPFLLSEKKNKKFYLLPFFRKKQLLSFMKLLVSKKNVETKSFL